MNEDNQGILLLTNLFNDIENIKCELIKPDNFAGT
jgi:hypothetical protein